MDSLSTRNVKIRKPTERESKDWLQQTKGMMRNPVRLLLDLHERPDREIEYNGTLVPEQELWIVRELNTNVHV